jgi:riboflavin kinase/FMN adenylyltransferase
VCHSPAEWAQVVRSAWPGRRAVLAIGTFDGLHLGHQQILRHVVDRARHAAQPAIAGAVTFDPHPARVLRPEQAPPLIATLAQRLEGFRQGGLEAALVLKFDRALSHLSPEEFVRSILVEHLHAALILVGENFRFGHRQAGDIRLLVQLGQRHDFQVEVVPPVRCNGEVVSSTAVRQAVAAGDVARAARLLGRPFTLTGKVQPGAGRGRTVLFPTLNLQPEQELLPRAGVYATETRVGGQWFFSATNVGYRPTVDAQAARVTVESHLLDFTEQMAAGELALRFHSRLRDERKFESISALREQIQHDIQHTRDFFQRNRETLKA